MKRPTGPFRLEVDEYERGDDDMPLREIKTRARTIRDAAEIYRQILSKSLEEGRGIPELVTYGRLYKGAKRVATVLPSGEVWCANRKKLYWKGEANV